jgi:transcriptional regulator with XRE-family HTH domain
MPDVKDFPAMARDLVRALRGRRSQTALSRRLGYRTNVVYTWEKGRRWPSGSELVRVAERTGAAPREAIIQFFGRAPPWLEEVAGEPAALVRAFLRELRGDIPIGELADRAGFSRYSVSRWLSGKAEPRLPELLALVEAASFRVLDFVAGFVDPAELPSTAEPWSMLEARRDLAWRLPWSHAVLRALELEPYRALSAHRPGWIARCLGIDRAEEQRCLNALEAASIIGWDGYRYTVEEGTVDITRAPEEGRRVLRAHFTEVARERILEGREGQFSWNVFSVSRADFERLRELHIGYLRAFRAIVADSAPAEMVAVANVQLFPLGEPPRR